MKIEFNINPEGEEIIVIHAKQMTNELMEVVQMIETKLNAKKIYGKHDDKVFPIVIEDVAQFVVEDRSVRAITKNGNKLKLDQRLYQIEEQLSINFIRISKSEIINIKYIDHLKVEPNGLIQIMMKNGYDTYSSRRYLKSIKERLEL